MQRPGINLIGREKYIFTEGAPNIERLRQFKKARFAIIDKKETVNI